MQGCWCDGRSTRWVPLASPSAPGARRETAQEPRRVPWRRACSGACRGTAPCSRCWPFPLDASLHRLDGSSWDSMGRYGRPGHLAGPGGFSAPAFNDLARSADSGFVPARKTARRPVSRVLSRPVSHGRRTTIPLGRASRRASRDQPGRRSGNAPAPCGAAIPIRSCSRWGLPCRPCCQGRGALLPHRFALARGMPCGTLHGRFVFCGTFPGVAPAGGYPAPYSRGARTFLCRLRDSGRPAVWRRERWLRSSLRVKAQAATERWFDKARSEGSSGQR